MRCCAGKRGLILVGVSVVAVLLDQAKAEDAAIPAPSGVLASSVCNPQGSLTLSGSTLYGISVYGGVRNLGSIFNVPVKGGSPTILTYFDGRNGAHPWGGLALRGATLYGMTSAGGAHGSGTVFSMPVTGDRVTVLASLDGVHGTNPRGSLAINPDGSIFYGTSRLGGKKNLGAVLSIPVRGGDPTILASFDGDNGIHPSASLILHGSMLYGTATNGGAKGRGTVFSVPIHGGEITVLASFDGAAGSPSLGSLTLGDSTLYGMTWIGGAKGKGGVFGVPVNGGPIRVLGSFDGSNGAQPTGSLTLHGSSLYGMTNDGGPHGAGIVFRVPIHGGDVTALAAFTPRDRIYPGCTLTLSHDGSTLYGMTTPGGACLPGSLFSIPTGGQPSAPRDITEFLRPPPPQNWLTDVERLKRVIRETVKPKAVEQKPLPPDLEAALAWSKPVNGLVARIEYVWSQTVFFVRLKNVSDQPLSVPTANGTNSEAGRLFDAYVQQGAKGWRQTIASGLYGRYFSSAPALDTDDGIPAGRGPSVRQAAELQSSDRPWVSLQPGQSAIVLVECHDPQDTGETKNVKVVLRQPEISIAGRWNGVLETPPQVMALSRQQHGLCRAALPFPDHFPPLSHDYSGSFTCSPAPSAVELLQGPNEPLIALLAIYEPAGVVKEFERRMQAERALPMKLLLAGVAATAGSEDAAMYFLETMRHSDYRTVVNLHEALWTTLRSYLRRPPDGQQREPPPWLVELCLAILSDHRTVTGMEKTNFQKGTLFLISSCHTGNLLFALGELKCRKLIPLLVTRVKRREADWYTLQALGAIGDSRAIPVLIEGVKLAYFDNERYGQAVYALGRLKAREAVPALLEDIDYPESIEALGEIGDPRAIGALREVVAAKGRIVREGSPVTPERDARRLSAARVALTSLEGEEGVVHLAAMLDDPTLERYHRYEVALRLARRPDPRAIPYLVKAIKTHSDHSVINLAIGALGELKYRAAAEGLIECFDVPFKAADLGKGERVTPATYRNYIARSLQQITGQPFGADKSTWLRWWREVGSKSTALK